jgi:periplasmic protein CpxP/Spy
MGKTVIARSLPDAEPFRGSAVLLGAVISSELAILRLLAIQTDRDTAMPFVAHSITMPAPVIRSFAIGALLGATMLASPLAAARAETASSQMAQASAPRSQAGAGAMASKSETVEQHITNLHASLKITPDEETKWSAVATAMRENAAAADKVTADTQAAPGKMTAVDDLEMYQKYAQAHVDGLKNLISSFSALYSAMPDAQKKTADSVFQSAHQAAAAARGQTG